MFIRLHPSLTLSNVSLATCFPDKFPLFYSQVPGCFLFIFYFFIDWLTDWSIERWSAGEREGETHWCGRETSSINCLLCGSWQGTKPATQAYALTSSQTRDIFCSVGQCPTYWATPVRFSFFVQLEIMTASCGSKKCFFPHLFNSSILVINQIGRDRLTEDNVQSVLY